MDLDRATKTPKARSQSIDRAGLILTCFSGAEPYLTLAEIAERLGLPQSTAYRYTSTLEEAGLLERDSRRGGYRLGLQVVELAGVALNQIAARREAIPEMDRLRDELQLLVNLAMLDPRDMTDIIHVAHAAPPGWPIWVATPGRRAIAYCTALGKTLLSYQPWANVQHAIELRGWRTYTERSIQTFDALVEELERIRQQGYAEDDGERSPDTRCLAAPILDHSGQAVAALSVSGSSQRFTPDKRQLALPAVMDAAKRVSLRLGYAGSLAYE